MKGKGGEIFFIFFYSPPFLLSRLNFVKYYIEFGVLKEISKKVKKWIGKKIFFFLGIPHTHTHTPRAKKIIEPVEKFESGKEKEWERGREKEGG